MILERTMNAFKKTITVVVAAATIGATFASAPATAGWRGHHGGYGGGAAAAGVLGVLALGAIAASAASAPSQCWIERRAVTNRFGDVVGYRRIRVCN
jgi:hypothetical protein